MPKYRWSCHACSLSNPPASATCSGCGCAATASWTEIAAAKRRAGIVEPVDGPTLGELGAWLRGFISNPSDHPFLGSLVFELVTYGVAGLVLLVVLKACEALAP